MSNMSASAFLRLMTNGHGKNYFPLNSLLSDGNTKLPSTTAIFNMSTATDCPSRKLGLCSAYYKGKCICYALKPETNHWKKVVLPYREKQTEFWLNTNAKDFVFQFVAINELKDKPFTAMRFNEAGDFHGQSCVNKAEKIAKALNTYNVKVYCYTARKDLDFSKVKHLIVSGSNFKKEGIVNEFRIVTNKSHRPKGFGICAMDCNICQRCQIRGMNTVVKMH